MTFFLFLLFCPVQSVLPAFSMPEASVAVFLVVKKNLSCLQMAACFYSMCSMLSEELATGTHTRAGCGVSASGLGWWGEGSVQQGQGAGVFHQNHITCSFILSVPGDL